VRNDNVSLGNDPGHLQKGKEFTISDKMKKMESERSAKITEGRGKLQKVAFTKRCVALINVACHGFSNP
jgi:hypothetical protein